MTGRIREQQLAAIKHAKAPEYIPDFARQSVPAYPAQQAPAPGPAGRRGPRLPDYEGVDLPGPVVEWYDHRSSCGIAVHPGDVGYSEVSVCAASERPEVWRWAISRHKERVRAERAELEAQWAAERAQLEAQAAKELALWQEEKARRKAEEDEARRIAAEAAEQSRIEQDIRDLLAGEEEHQLKVQRALTGLRAKLANPRPKGSRKVTHEDGSITYEVPA